MKKRIKGFEQRMQNVMFMTGQTNRIKRGFFAFIGDIPKTLFGTLDEKDAQYYNEELDKLR